MVLVGIIIGSYSVYAAEYTMKISAGVTGDECPWYRGTDYLEKRVPQLTGGKVEVKTYKGTLQTGRRIIEDVKLGTVEGLIETTGPLSGFVPRATIFNLPMLFKGFDHLFKAVDGPFGDSIAKDAEKSGFKILGWWSYGARMVYHNGKPIRTVEDIKGMKIRTQESPEFLSLYKSYGAQPVPMQWTEVYSGLQQGVIDGADATLGAGIASKHIEVVKYAALIDHVLAVSPILVSLKWWDALPQDTKTALEKAFKEAQPIAREADKVQAQQLVLDWEKRGKIVTRPDLGGFQKAAEKVYVELKDKINQQDLAWVKQVGQ